MAHEQDKDVEQLLAMAADRPRSARAELTAASFDLFRPVEHRLTDQQRAVMGDVLRKLVAAVELEIRQYLVETLLNPSPELAAMFAADAEPLTYPLLESAGLLRDLSLLRRVMQRSEEHRLALAAADGALDTTAGANLFEALARSPDPELARRAVAYVVIETKRRDRFGEPLLLGDDLTEALAVRLHWQVGAALRRHLLGAGAAPDKLDPPLEAVVRRALAEHSEGRGVHARALRLAARLHELGELTDDFLRRSLVQGHLAMFVAGLATRSAVSVDIAWQSVTDRGRHSLLVLLRAIEMDAGIAGAIVEALETGQPLARSPAAQRALIAAYGALDPAAARRQLREWQLDADFRQAIDELDAGAPW